MNHEAIKWFSEGIKPAPPYEAWHLKPQDRLRDLSWVDAANHLIDWGLLAPSAHNKQGWVVRVDEADRSITIFPRQSDIGAPSDTKGRQTYIGVGCFAANVQTACTGYGIDIPIEIMRPQQEAACAVQFHCEGIQSGVLTHPDLFGLMRDRRVYRGPFKSGVPLPNDLAETMTRTAKEASIRMEIITDVVTKNALAELQALANRIVLLVPEFRNELAHHLVPNDTPLTRVMPADTFGLSDESVRRIQLSLQGSGQFDGDFAAGFANSDRDAIENASALIVLSVAQDKPDQWIHAGMVFQQLWLLAHQRRFAVGVMAAMVESTTYNRMLKMRLGQIKERPVVVFRIGKPTEDRPHSPRIPRSELFQE